MPAANWSKVRSPFSAAHSEFLRVTKTRQREISLAQARSILMSTPGLVFEPGTSSEDVFEYLESWGVIQKEGNLIKVRDKYEIKEHQKNQRPSPH